MKTKEELRSHLRTCLSSMDPSLKINLEKLVVSNLEQILSKHKFEVLGIYAPMKDELNWSSSLLLKNMRLAFPRYKNGLMEFIESDFEDLQISDEFGVSLLVPKGDKAVMPDLLIIPALGFSKQGGRLGRGKGFYDRFLVSFRGLKIGCGFSFQVISELPEEEHDQRMNIIVTEDEILNIKE